MVKHLRGLRTRETTGDVGFDLYTTIVVDCDNVGKASLVTGAPAPQPGEVDDYEGFVRRFVRFYGERFSDLR